MNSYNLSRSLFDYSFENTGKIKPNHIAVYFFAIEHCNRLGWKEQFGFPTSMVMEAVGISSYNTFKKVLKELIEFGFIEMIQESKNQYQSNIIALSKFDKALDKALDKAMINHLTKQDKSTDQDTAQSIDSINKHQTTNKETSNHKQDACEENSDNSENENSNQEVSQKKIKTEFFKKTSEFFSQTTEVLQMRMFGDFKRIENNGKLEQFEKQTIAYIEYKQKSKEVFHRCQNYLSEWESENWVDKLKKSKSVSEKKEFEQNKSQTIKSIEL